MMEFEEVELGFVERQVARLVRWLIPSEGLLTLVLTLTAIFCTTAAVIDANWIPDLLFLTWVGFLAVIITLIVIKQPIPAWRSIFYVLAYGVTATLAGVGQLVPNVALFIFDRPAALLHFQTQWATFFDRLGGWWRTVSSGGSSSEIIMFALLITAITWLVAAYLTWATFHKRTPLTALSLIAFALACNSYFSNASGNWVAIFIVVLIALTAQMRLLALERYWTRNRIDYSREIYFDLFISVIFVGMFIATLSAIMPRVSIRRVAQAFQNSAFVLEAEETLERAFGGVNAPRRAEGSGSGDNGGEGDRDNGTAGVGRGSGVLPRAYLLGGAPELYETVVMTATVAGDATTIAQARHWRALSYDDYTGRGWAIRDERQQDIPAQTALPIEKPENTETVTTAIYWIDGSRASRYSLGLPLAYNQKVTTFWRGNDDLVRVQGGGNQYQSDSLLSTATPLELRAAELAKVSPVIINRYTALPKDLPQRIHDLALEITAGATTPYDQALAIERFLRQYEYSLDISAPPSDVDVVDYFLFESQVGYCDYYASAMTVLARSIGLPARIAAGFAAVPTDANGQQTLRQIDGHSWSEIYFADYGWIEFEPTASFRLGVSEQEDELASAENTPPTPTTIPERSRVTVQAWLPIIGLLMLTVSALLRFGRRQPDTWARRYARLHDYAQRLQVSTFAGQTPAEFQIALDTALIQVASNTKLMRLRTQTYIKILRREALEACNGYARELYDQESAELPNALLLNRRFDWLLTAIRIIPQNFMQRMPQASAQHPPISSD